MLIQASLFVSFFRLNKEKLAASPSGDDIRDKEEGEKLNRVLLRRRLTKPDRGL